MKKMADLSGSQRLSKGSAIFREGDMPDFVYGLIEGRVSLVSGKDQNQTVVDFVGPGDLVLVPPVLLCVPYMVSAKAISDVLVVMMPAADFRQLAEIELALSAAVGRIMAQHWRALLSHLTQSRLKDADSRVVHFLLENADRTVGPASLTLPASKQDLAAHLGITPATLSRSFKRLSRLGVTISQAHIEIENVPTLEAHLFQLRQSASRDVLSFRRSGR